MSVAAAILLAVAAAPTDPAGVDSIPVVVSQTVLFDPTPRAALPRSGGLTYDLAPDWNIDAGRTLGLSGRTDDARVFVGTSLRF